MLLVENVRPYAYPVPDNPELASLSILEMSKLAREATPLISGGYWTYRSLRATRSFLHFVMPQGRQEDSQQMGPSTDSHLRMEIECGRVKAK